MCLLDMRWLTWMVSHWSPSWTLRDLVFICNRPLSWKAVDGYDGSQDSHYIAPEYHVVNSKRSLWHQHHHLHVFNFKNAFTHSRTVKYICILTSKCDKYKCGISRHIPLPSLQVSGWPSAGLPQKRPPPRHLLPSVAVAWPPVPPRAAGGGAVRVRLPHKEGWSVC